jgi:transcriptional regulator with GAF, ATPase, and Fis domain
MSSDPSSQAENPGIRAKSCDDDTSVPFDEIWAELAVRSVGHLSLTEVRDHVTKKMLEAALARAEHNYSKAAKLLCVTRQSVQYLVVRHEVRADHAWRVSRRLSRH